MLSGEQDRVLRRVLRLVDLSGDLDRNKSDGDFAALGGVIFTAVDENIFEMFIRPSRHADAVETFYADLWSPTSKVDEEWRSLEAQAALITAEFILSDRHNAGAASLLMSDHHRWELAHRVEALTSEIRAEVTKRRKAVRGQLQTKLAISADLQNGKLEKASLYAVSLKSRTLSKDLAELAGAPQSVIDRFHVARLSAAFFANDPYTEPLEQLRRTVSSEMRSNLRSLQGTFRTSRNENQSIEADAQRWFERLARELRQPGHRHRKRAQYRLGDPERANPKEEAARALRNDARTIAFVQWLARNRLVDGQRIVFITGDAVLFDAYRRWHVENAEAGRTAQPFVLRRARQYSPILNPSDSRGDLSGTPAGDLQTSVLFTLIQQAIETALLPLPFALEMQTRVASDPALNLTRERLALKLVDSQRPGADAELSGLADLLSPKWLQERSHQIESIRHNWQKAHRFAIGASTDLISARLGRRLKDAATAFFANAARDAAPILREYVANLLDRLVDDSILLWVPLAERFQPAQFEADPSNLPKVRRFAVALSAPSTPTAEAAATLASPQEVFARAACRALETQDVDNASRFATLARRAENVADLRRGERERPNPDLLYLQGVTDRYLICTVGTHLKRASSESRRSRLVAKGVDQVKRYYGRAANHIDKCLAVHAAELDEPMSAVSHWNAEVRFLRALSERAALNLFMATSLGLAARIGRSPLLSDWERHLEYTRGDLWRCVKADAFEDDDDPVLQTVRGQFIPNLAAYEVLAYILSGGSDFQVQPWPKKFRRRLVQIWEDGTDVHPLLAVELRGYFLLSEQKLGQRRPITQRFLPREQQQLRLPLDRELYWTIRREMPWGRGAKRAFPSQRSRRLH